MRLSTILLSILLLFSGAGISFAQIGQNVKWKAELVDGKIVITGTPSKSINHVSGTVTSISCTENQCFTPEDWEFDLPLETAEALPAEQETQSVQAIETQEEASVISEPAEPSNSKENQSLLSLIIKAILWGFAMLLTPCVFPMVPMTVSFFIKGNASKRKGRRNALLYGLFIVLLYTIPICLIIGATWIIGGSTVTADIFNWLSTHWLPNLVFFLVFLAFALSFFGLFEITLPSKWVNSSDEKSDRKGLAGIFFMALTLVLVSFSCTGPIVGTVLIQSTSGEFWTPMITMLAFSVAFALPFVLLALFPGMLKSLPKSGGWMETVKVSLGFIELALGLKFLSVADQTYHWGILPRNVYLAIWVVLFILLIFYLTGLLRFNHSGNSIKWSTGRIVWLSIVSAFTIYLFSGFYGNSLSAISGYLPPVDEKATVDTGKAVTDPTDNLGTELLEKAYVQAQKDGKRVFVDITGYGCVNCREMEQRVWTNPEVQEAMKDFIIVKIYVDDKTKLPESKWMKTSDGKTLKDVGRANSYLALEKFGVNSQPNYFILSAEGKKLKGPYAYDLSIDNFMEFLK